MSAPILPVDATAVSFLLQAAPWASLDVRRGSQAEVSVQISSGPESANNDPQECLVWQFELQEFDIGFQLLENGTALENVVRYKAAIADDDADVGETAIASPLQQEISTHEPVAEGKLEDVKSGTVYTFRWDNSYSLMRHKKLRYRFLTLSKRALAAAEVAVQESQARRRSRRRAKELPLPHLAKTLARERAMTDSEATCTQERIQKRLEECVMDIVSIFMAKPDSPLHEGAVRPFILALEAVLRNGIKEEFLDLWPEEPYYEFLLDTNTVLRDDLGIVAEVEAEEPPVNWKYLGWNRSRSFLFRTLNMNILHRALENLSKRRTLLEKYYEPRALLYKYSNAAKISSFLSALNGVKFLLASYPENESNAEEEEDFPQNLVQCSPEAPLPGAELLLQDEMTGDSLVVKCDNQDPGEIKQLKNCTLPRSILHGKEVKEATIGRASIELLPFLAVEDSLILVAQLRVQTQDILVSLCTESGQELTEPLQLSAADGWVEVIVRLKATPTKCLAVKLDNSYSMVRTKQVQLRYAAVNGDTFTLAWEGCLEMAQSISWNHTSKAGAERCAEYMASLHQKEEQEVTLQRIQDGVGRSADDSQDGGEDGIKGFGSNLLVKPVSYWVGGLLSTEGALEACEQCLAPFSFFSRQHTCPCCQRVVCITCSRHCVQLNGKGPQLKVCDRCFIEEKDKERKRVSSMQGDGSGQGGERPEYTALGKDPAMEKYFRMLGFGVPASGVAQKMTQDEMPADKVAIFAAGPDGSIESPLSSRTKRMRAVQRGISRRDSTFRKVHWTSLETKNADDTIWRRVTARRKTAPITLSAHDFQELEYLFGNPSASSPTKVKGKQSSAKRFSALDSRRASNIAIGLTQFKAVGGANAVITALKSCDFEFLTPDRLSNLRDIAPNSVEVKRYTDFRGARSKLEPAERLLVEMCEISRVTEKISTMLFASQFEHQQQELRNRIQVITRACYEVLQSERLARCFELVLAIGNLLNTGTDLEDAHGVTLASLLKLSEAKAIDQSITLLQFIIKLIHDRGEGDVLLFIKDLGTLADAKRYSNVICDSQARALQHGIKQMEQEIKEDMVDDLKRFNKAEALRKRRFEGQMPQSAARLPLGHNGAHPTTMAGASNGEMGEVSSPRNALLSAIRKRDPEDDSTVCGQDETEATPVVNALAPMLAAIQNRRSLTANEGSSGDEENAHAAVLSASSTQSIGEGEQNPGASANKIASSSTANQQEGDKSALLEAIRRRSPTAQNQATSHEPGPNVSKESPGSRLDTERPTGRQKSGGATAKQADSERSPLFAAIRQAKQIQEPAQEEAASDDQLSTDRSALLASIQRRAEAGSENPPSSLTVSTRQNQPPNSSQAALLAAIRGRSKNTVGGSNTPSGGLGSSGATATGAKGPKFEPRPYKMESKFVPVMRESLMRIKAAFEELEMEVETLHSVWEATARYLAEDPTSSSSEYVFSLLNRFLLDVKVAKSLLFRKGLSFATEATSLLPHAHVGSTIITTFGSGVITALRIADSRVEIKFPWSREAYVSPSCILGPGSLVRCRWFGIGVIRQMCYDVGMCDVRFGFGFGKVRVQDLLPETSSNKDELKREVLRSGFCIDDPVVTPFGCGHIQAIHAPRANDMEATISVGLLATENDAFDGERMCAGVAFMPASRVKRNY